MTVAIAMLGAMQRASAWVLAVGLGWGCGDNEPAPPEAPPRADDARATERDTRADCPAPGPGLATRMGAKMSDICAKAAVPPMERDAAIDRELQGHWEGQYSGDAMEPVDFEADLSTIDGTVSGSTSEPNTFGPYGYARLEASLTGDAFASRQVVLLKTYRTGDTDHSVLYVGTLSESGRRIEGYWRLGGRRGTFWIERR